MRAHYIIILFFFFVISLSTSFSVQFNNAAEECIYLNDNNEQKNRRILHQPLFPLDSPLPPPPPLPPTPDSPFDQPFSNELPPLDQNQQSPPLPAIGTAVTTPTAAHHPSSNLTKKLTVATLSTILTLAMLSAMAFYLYKNRAKHTDESHKLVGENSTRINEESRMPPSTLHCIERAEPSTSGSPYQKLNSGKASNHYRPSPDLQPLPPLTKPPPPFRINSPPPMSSSDDESHDTRVYTLQGTSPSSHHRHISNNANGLTQARPENHVAASVPHSKRTPPKSRFSASSPDARILMLPSSKQPFPPSPPPLTTSLGPMQASKTLPYSPKRTKFSPPPPSPAIEKHRPKSNYQQKISTIPIPPPPPPPPPTKYRAVKNCTPLPVSKQLMRSQSKSPSPKASPSSEKTSPALKIYKNWDGRWMILEGKLNILYYRILKRACFFSA